MTPVNHEFHTVTVKAEELFEVGMLLNLHPHLVRSKQKLSTDLLFSYSNDPWLCVFVSYIGSLVVLNIQQPSFIIHYFT